VRTAGGRAAPFPTIQSMNSRAQLSVTEYQTKEALAGLFLVGLSDEFSLRIQLGCDLLAEERFDLIADLNVVVVGDSDTAFHPAGDFLRVVLEPLKR
jgi:hypothetical protein